MEIKQISTLGIAYLVGILLISVVAGLEVKTVGLLLAGLLGLGIAVGAVVLVFLGLVFSWNVSVEVVRFYLTVGAPVRIPMWKIVWLVAKEVREHEKALQAHREHYGPMD